METKIKHLDLTDVEIEITINQTLKSDLDDPFDDIGNMDTIIGKIFYNDPNKDLDDTLEIGSFVCYIFYGCEYKIYNAIDHGISVTDADYLNEIFEVEHREDLQIVFYLRNEYYNLMPDIDENRFMILNEIKIDENFRGKGILGSVIKNINRTFRQPILVKPFPLQHSGKTTKINYKEDLKKVVNAYKKCGFVRARKRSDYFIYW